MEAGATAPSGRAPVRQRRADEDGRRQLLIGLALGLLLLVLLMALWAATGNLDDMFGQGNATPRIGLLPSAETAGRTRSIVPEAVPPLGAPPGAGPQVGARFADFYTAAGGLDIFGLPISEPLSVNGREVQWFERARLEHWPEYAGTPYEIQAGRIGVEYTQGRTFPEQTFLASRPGLRYFAETRHAVGGRFLAYWEQHGGLAVFGFPISDEFDELLADGNVYRVQYFERARLEYHPQHAGSAYEVQPGLLGRALYLNESRPETIPPAPTAAPLP